MLEVFRRSIGRRVMYVVLATTFIALLAAGAALLVYDARAYRDVWVSDLRTQADLLARTSAAALAFHDRTAADENLSLLRARPNILAGAIYTPSGELFASYSQPGAPRALPLPDRPRRNGYSISGNQLFMYRTIVESGQPLGTVYLRSRYELNARMLDYGLILAGVMVGSLLLALAIAVRLQRNVTAPIRRLTQTAREVIERRDFSLRVRRTTQDEIGVLVDAFNEMLMEVGRRASALEQTNRALQREMTERREAEEALLLADRRKDEFLATLAHELRNPLAPMRNGLEIMRFAGHDQAKLNTVREMMQRQLSQMVRLIDDLLDVSRITTGRLAVRKEPAVLQAILQSAIETARPVIEAKNHRLAVDMPAEPIELLADATRLAQVFSNLLNNAARYTPAGGAIGLQVRAENAQLLVSVSDTGIGLSAADMDAVFGMFVQVDQSLERTNAGLGVGLSLARRLVELHGGSIEARSAGPGRGSTFTVRLPHGPQASAPREPARPRTAAAAGPWRILLADDNVDFVDGLAMILRQYGHEVRVAHDGAAALREAAALRPQFAFLDIGLPQVNGYALAEHLRALPETAHCVLTAVTGWGQQADRERARQAGFHFHLVKPVEAEQIQRILDGEIQPSAQATC